MKGCTMRKGLRSCSTRNARISLCNEWNNHSSTIITALHLVCVCVCVCVYVWAELPVCARRIDSAWIYCLVEVQRVIGWGQQMCFLTAVHWQYRCFIQETQAIKHGQKVCLSLSRCMLLRDANASTENCRGFTSEKSVIFVIVYICLVVEKAWGWGGGLASVSCFL